jgi:AcrR family transcriptional regulator
MVRKKIGNKEQDILEAAIKIFSEKSYHGTTTKEIAQEAGVSEGTIFRYFDTKKDILFSVVKMIIENHAHQELVKSLGLVIKKNKDLELKMFLKAIIKDRVVLIKRNLSLIKVIFFDLQYHPDILKVWTENIARPMLSALTKIVEEKKKTEEINDSIDSEILVRSLVGSIIFMVLSKYALYGNNDFDIDYEIDKILDYYIYGIGG